MISEKTYKKYKYLVKYEPTGILHLLSGTLLYTHEDNTGIGSKAKRMMNLHQYLVLIGAFKGTSYDYSPYKMANDQRFPLVFRTVNSAKSYMGMVLDQKNPQGYIFHVEDSILAAPTQQSIIDVRSMLYKKQAPIKRHINEFDFLPMDYDSTMRLYTDHKLTKEQMLNEIHAYEAANLTVK